MTTEAIILTCICSFNFLLGINVLKNNVKKRKNIYFLLLIFGLNLFLIINFILEEQNTKESALFVARLLFTITPFILLFIHLFINSFSLPKRKNLSIFTVIYIASIIFIFIISQLTTTLVQDIDMITYPYGVIKGNAYPIYILCIAIDLILLSIEILKIKKLLKGREILQFQYISFGVILSISILILTNVLLPIIGINLFVRVSGIATLAFTISATYSIIIVEVFSVKTFLISFLKYVLTGFIVLIFLTSIRFLQLRVINLTEFSKEKLVTDSVLAVLFSYLVHKLICFFDIKIGKLIKEEDTIYAGMIDKIDKIAQSVLSKKELINSIKYELENKFKDYEIIFYHKDNDKGIENKYLVDYIIVQNIEEEELREDYYSKKIAIVIQINKEIYLVFRTKLNYHPFTLKQLNIIRQIVQILSIAFQRIEVIQKIKDFNLILNNKVSEQTVEITNKNKTLEKAYQELQTIDKAKSDFISIASHQLRTPISVIRGYLSMVIAGDYGQMENELIKKAIVGSYENVERLAGIVNEILNASRIEQGRLGITIEKTDLIKMMSKISSNQEKAAKAKNLIFKVILPDVKQLIIECDPEKIYEVISNLIDNAIQYTIKGKVIAEVKDMNSYVLIIITDTGIGIPENQKDKLFQRFIRLDNAKLVKPDGTGIGLFTTKKILEAHNGEVWFKSIEGQGSRFFIKLLKIISQDSSNTLAKP